MLVVDLFAGPGGWSTGAAELGIADVGLEWDADACATRQAAGHLTIRADVAQTPTGPYRGRVEGLIASPPCPTFSLAGQGAGTDSIHLLAAALDCVAEGDDGARAWVIDRMTEAGQSPRDAAMSALILEPMRWIRDTRPRWVAMEQVPPAMPLWHHYADLLRRLGYSSTAAILNAADYGVPQTRRRAILVARSDAPAVLPEPTHAKHPAPSLFGQLEPWVSMAEALGWGMAEAPYPTVACSRTTGGPDKEKVGGSRDRAALYAERDAGRWVRLEERQANGASRTADEPAPTLTASMDNGNFQWLDGSDAIRVELDEAAVLQGFPSDYPFQGTKSAKFRQVSDAVCPPLARHILAALLT